MENKSSFYSILHNSSKEICSKFFDAQVVYKELTSAEGSIDKTIEELNKLKDFFISYSELDASQKQKIEIFSRINDIKGMMSYVESLSIGRTDVADGLFINNVMRKFRAYIVKWIPAVLVSLVGLYFSLFGNNSMMGVENSLVVTLLSIPLISFLLGFFGFVSVGISGVKASPKWINRVGSYLNPWFKKNTGKNKDFEIEESASHSVYYNYMTALLGNIKDISQVRFNESVLSDFDCLEPEEQQAALEKGSKFSCVDIATIDDVYHPFSMFMEYKFQQEYVGGNMEQRAKDRFKRWGKDLMPSLFLVNNLSGEQIKVARYIYYVNGYQEVVNYIEILNRLGREHAGRFFYKQVHSVIAKKIATYVGVAGIVLVMLPYFVLNGDVKIILQLFGLVGLGVAGYINHLAGSYKKINFNRRDLSVMTNIYLSFAEKKHVANIEKNKQRHNFVFRNYMMLLEYIDTTALSLKMPKSSFEEAKKNALSKAQQ